MKTLYMLGGPMGVGKTTVCQLLKKRLPNCVYLDGDWCWDADPFQVTEETKVMVLDNICDMLNRFLHCTAYENIVFGWVMHEQAILDSIVGKLDTASCQVRQISLLADEDSLRQRLLQDVADGLRTSDVIERSLARLPLYQKLNTIKMDTSGKTALQVAEMIASI